LRSSTNVNNINNKEIKTLNSQHLRKILTKNKQYIDRYKTFGLSNLEIIYFKFE